MQMKLMTPERATLNNIEAPGRKALNPSPEPSRPTRTSQLNPDLPKHPETLLLPQKSDTLKPCSWHLGAIGIQDSRFRASCTSFRGSALAVLGRSRRTPSSTGRLPIAAVQASILNMAKARKEGGDQAATNLPGP